MLLLVLCVVAGALAAPQFNHHPHYRPPFFEPRPYRPSPYFNEDIFDTGKFWNEMNRELRELDEMLNSLSTRFPTAHSQMGFEGNEYKITIPMQGYEEKDIVVKAREGFLMVQAVHTGKEGDTRSYLVARTLPDNVSVNGTWTYEKELLTIVFPVKGVQPTTTESVIFTTQAPAVSKEELIPQEGNDNQNADVGLERGDLDAKPETDHDKELATNMIVGSGVEATTYAVDVKDQYEFVPMKY